MNIDEATKFLTRGRAQNFNQAINIYKQMLISKNSDQDQNLEQGDNNNNRKGRE